MDRKPHGDAGAASGDRARDRTGPLSARVLGGAFAAALLLVLGLVALVDRLLS